MEEKKRGRGQARKFESAEEFENTFNEYIEYCELNERMVNIAGFCRYARMTRETFYNQKEYYFDTYMYIQETIEDETLNDNKRATPIVMMYLKNKFNYKDKIETENTNTNTNKNYDVSNLTDEQLDKILKGE